MKSMLDFETGGGWHRRNIERGRMTPVDKPPTVTVAYYNRLLLLMTFPLARKIMLSSNMFCRVRNR